MYIHTYDNLATSNIPVPNSSCVFFFLITTKKKVSDYIVEKEEIICLINPLPNTPNFYAPMLQMVEAYRFFSLSVCLSTKNFNIGYNF